MKSANPAHPGARDTPAARPTDTKPGKTPNADMQPEDTGSEASSEDAATDSATAATRAMKQTSKTATESGGKR